MNVKKSEGSESMPPSGYRRISVIALVVVLSGVLARVLGPPPSNSVTVDGYTIRMLGAGYGKNIEIPATGAIDWMRRAIPWSWVKWMGPPVYVPGFRSNWTSSHERLGVFLDLGGIGLNGTNICLFTDLRLVGRSGQKYRAETGGSCSEFVVFNWSVFPRRDQSFQIEGKFQNSPFSFEVRNPVYRSLKSSNYVAQPLPATQSVEGYDFTLERVQLSPSNTFSVDWSVEKAGKKLTNAFHIRWNVSDGTGNFRWAPTNEPVWKLRGTAHKHDPDLLHTNEYLSLKAPFQPKPGELKLLDLHQNVNGVTIEHLGVGGPGRFFVSNTFVSSLGLLEPGMQRDYRHVRKKGRYIGREVTRTTPWLTIRSKQTVFDPKITCFAYDTEGDRIPVEEQWLRSGTYYLVDFHLDMETNQILGEIRIAPQHLQRLEFYADPAQFAR